MRRHAVVTLAAAALALVLAAPARAATLTDSGGQLRFVAAAGIANVVSLDESLPGIVVVQRWPAAGDADPISSVSGCVPIVASTTYLCSGVSTVYVDAGNGNDVIDAGGALLGSTGLLTIPATLVGGDGGDLVYGGAANDSLQGGADNDQLYGGGGDDVVDGGDGNDTLDGGNGNDALTGDAGNDTLTGDAGNDALLGGDGDDTLDGGPGADSYGGGAGNDTAVVSAVAVAAPDLSVTLDGLANDGAAGEGDSVGTDVESVVGSARSFGLEPGTVTLTGNAGANTLTVKEGRGLLVGGPGADVLNGGPQDDAIDARDGFADTVTCGAGNDVVAADPLDKVAPDCERVLVAPAGTPSGLGLPAAPPPPPDDAPPTVAWTSPKAGVTLSADKPTRVSVSAGDDHGVALVRFYAGERLACAVAAPPYTCAYQPSGAEVGHDTLVAVAVDTSGQTATAMLAVSVGRFTPALSVKASKRRGKRLPVSGKLALPATVTAKQGCAGHVTLTAKVGKRMVATKTVALGRSCRYSAMLALSSPAAKKLTLGARFAGNGVLAAGRAPARTARV